MAGITVLRSPASEKRDARVVTAQRAALRSARRAMSDPINISDFETLARERMEPSAYDYYAGGANDERTVAGNLRAFDRWVIRPRMLVGVREADTSTTVLGLPLTLPVALAPTAFNRLAHPDGELAAARAAGAAGTLMCCSTIASITLEEIAAAATGPLWFQLYVYRDRDVTLDLVRRAEAAGYRALMLTVDTPRLGRRERDVRNKFTLPPDIGIRNLERYGTPEALRWAASSTFTEYVHKLLDDSLTWESVDWLRTITSLPILIKGVLTRRGRRAVRPARGVGHRRLESRRPPARRRDRDDGRTAGSGASGGHACAGAARRRRPARNGRLQGTRRRGVSGADRARVPVGPL